MGDHASPERPPQPPLLRDPPMPPGYTDPLQDAGILAEPFSAPAPPAPDEVPDPVGATTADGAGSDGDHGHDEPGDPAA